MKLHQFLAVAVIFTLIIVTLGCGGRPRVDDILESEPTSEPAAPTPAGPPTPTKYVLATPTPLAPPPTPAPEATQPQEEAAEEQEPSAPTVTDIMVEIPAGPFTMGSDEGDAEDAPAHQVDLPAFEIDTYEVTNADFAVFADETGFVTYAEQQGISSWRDEWGIGEDNHPVVVVTWEDARAYCEWLGKRLPTEAEWEKAARGDDGRRFPWGNDWDPNKANVKERGLRGTSVVGSFGDGASPYGLEDMTGNVWEWTADWYQAYPGNTSGDAYYGEQFRVTRGGGWFDEEPQATSFNRNAADPSKTANDDLGFRCVR